GAGAGPVKELGLPDTTGTVHTTSEWAGQPALVLVFLAPVCPGSRACADELDRLTRESRPRGILFLGIDPTTGMDPDAMARRWSGWSVPFPILLDARRRVVRQAGVAVTPEAVVVLPDGQVVYRGPID